MSILTVGGQSLLRRHRESSVVAVGVGWQWFRVGVRVETWARVWRVCAPSLIPSTSSMETPSTLARLGTRVEGIASASRS